MDVINLSIGGTEIDPASDGLVRAVQGAVAAGVVVVIAAGNERELLGYGSIDSPGAADGAITVAATSSSRYFARSSAISGSAPVPTLLRAFGVAVPDTEHAPRRVAGRVLAAAAVGDARLCSRRPPGSFEGAIALADRGGCSVLKKARVARAAGAVAVLVPPYDASPPVPEIDETAVPVLVAPAPVVSALESYLADGARAAINVRTATREEATLPGVVATFSSAGPTPFDQRLKPDIAAPGVAILSSVPDSSSNEPGDWAVLDGTSMATPAVAGAAALLLEAHPEWTPAIVKSALMTTAHPAFVDAAGTREASPLTGGAGLVDVSAANAPGIVTEPQSLSFGEIADGGSDSIELSVRDLGGGAGDWAVSTRFVGPAPTGVAVSASAARLGAGGRLGDHRDADARLADRARPRGRRSARADAGNARAACAVLAAGRPAGAGAKAVPDACARRRRAAATRAGPATPSASTATPPTCRRSGCRRPSTGPSSSGASSSGRAWSTPASRSRRRRGSSRTRSS